MMPHNRIIRITMLDFTPKSAKDGYQEEKEKKHKGTSTRRGKKRWNNRLSLRGSGFVQFTFLP